MSPRKRRAPENNDPIVITAEELMPPGWRQDISPEYQIGVSPFVHQMHEKPLRTPDPVEHPAHYNMGKVEVIDAIESWALGFHEGNAVKYIARAKHKGSELEDLKKARWYLNRQIQILEGQK